MKKTEYLYLYFIFNVFCSIMLCFIIFIYILAVNELGNIKNPSNEIKLYCYGEASFYYNDAKSHNFYIENDNFYLVEKYRKCIINNV